MTQTLKGIRVDGIDPAHDNLVCLLGRLLSIEFEIEYELPPDGEAAVLFEAASPSESFSLKSELYRLSLPRRYNRTSPQGTTANLIRFGNEALVPFPFRGRKLSVQMERPAELLSVESGDTVLATAAGRPIWTVCRKNGLSHFRSALALPFIPDNGSLHDVLNSSRFMELLPLLHWLRNVTSAPFYEGPELRASFIFDDSNLHWPTYGRINYREIAAHAEKENYHVSFATIPLDTWLTHRPTAQIFRASPQRLSLLVHGNNHVKHELCRDYTLSKRRSLIRQGVQRIQRLERVGGLKVSRVMVPPHGACSEDMLAVLPECGFEAACISHGSLRAHNRSKTWVRSVGVLPSELVLGCPVLPRWSLAGNVNTVLLAAFLNQPVILRGHHKDLKEGIEILDQWAQVINGLGMVKWADTAELSRLNYQQRIEGDTWRLRPLSRKIVCDTPSDVTRIIVDPPPEEKWDHWIIQHANGRSLQVQPGVAVSQSGSAGSRVTVSVASPAPELADPVRDWSATAIVRRLLTECRDRVLP